MKHLRNHTPRTVVIGGLLAGIITLCLHAPAVSAHVIRSDGLVSIELHVPPTDHPKAREVTTYLLSFEDEPADFSIDNYITTTTILLGDKVIRKAPLGTLSEVESTNAIVFPEKGTYALRVHGQAVQPNIASFTMEWPIVVAEEPKQPQKISSVTLVGGAAGIAAIMIAGIVMELRGRSTKQP